MTVEREIFAQRVDNQVTESENRVYRAMRPLIEDIIRRIDQLVQQGREIDDRDLERVFAPLNDELRSVLGTEMFVTQPELRSLAASWADVVALTPILMPADLLKRASMDDRSMWEWFERASPSPWMRSLMDAAKKAIDDGWTRHREALRGTVENTVATATETGLLSNANQSLMANWTAREFIWHTRADELVCPICAPKQGTVYSGASNGPPSAAHPRCRCVGVAVR